ncbi:MAG TPA: T9SS type A sorting domain-containing protein [Parafilimonas sp.]|nr:T9SS type A sorting domain-containing protein [Parafilimonas sp.]
MKTVITTFLVLISCCSVAQHPWLLKDINSNGHQNRLSDGTYIGSESSTMNSSLNYASTRMYKVGSFALFFANDGNNKKRGLWKSDGTGKGTVFVSDMNFDSSWGMDIASSYTDGRLLYFLVYKVTMEGADYKSTFLGLWRSDGTSTGTFPIFAGDKKDVNAGTFSYPSPDSTKNIGNTYFFSGAQQEGDSVISYIYKTDGTISGTQPYFELWATLDSIEDPFSVAASNIVTLNGSVYFEHYDELHGREIWVGDGVQQPRMYTDFTPGTYSTYVQDWVNVNNQYILALTFNDSTYYGTYYLVSISSENSNPSIIESNNAKYYSYFLYDHRLFKYLLSNQKAFFEREKVDDQGNYIENVIEVTKGIEYDSKILNSNARVAGLSGTCSSGLIYFDVDNSFHYSTYIWDGNATSSSHPLSDSLQYPNSPGYTDRVVQIDSSLLIFTANFNSGIVWRMNLNGSNCYRIGYLYVSNEGVDLGDSVYLVNAADAPSEDTTGTWRFGTLRTGTEPCVIKKPQKIWTGTVSNDWGNKDNWLPVGVPNNSEDVIIPAVHNSAVITGVYSCRDLILAYGDLYVNQPGSLKISGTVFNSGNINGSGSISRTGTYLNTTYGLGLYNIDTINIDGNDWDLTSARNGYYTLALNSIINFKTNNKVIVNDAGLTLQKSPFFKNFSDKRFIELNHTFASYDGSPVSLNLNSYASPVDTEEILPVGTNDTSYTPFAFTYHYDNPSSTFSTYIKNEVRKNGAAGDIINRAVVNKTWFVSTYYYINKIHSFQFSWSAKDETPGFNPNACFIAYYNGSKWIQGRTQAAQLNNGEYTLKQDGFTNSGYTNTAFIVASSADVLPIYILSLEAVIAKADVVLGWETVKDINSAYFDVQRSIDGIGFRTISRISTDSASATTKNYNYTDVSAALLPVEVVYYRLEKVDKDGNSTLSKTIAVKLHDKNSPLILWPNPTTDKLNFRVTNSSGNATVQIIEVSGKQILNNNIKLNNDDVNINTAGLKAGLYILQVTINGATLKQPFLKE